MAGTTNVAKEDIPVERIGDVVWLVDAPFPKRDDPGFGNDARLFHVNLCPSYVVQDHGYETPCWIWRGILSPNHAIFKIGRKSHQVHKMMYEHRFGEVEDGFALHHKCQIKPCIRPDHLRPLTLGDHIREHARLSPLKTLREKIVSEKRMRKPVSKKPKFEVCMVKGCSISSWAMGFHHKSGWMCVKHFAQIVAAGKG